MTPEFSRLHRLDRIGTGESQASVEATPEERAALARRFRLLGVDRLSAEFTLRRDAVGVVAHGTLEGAVVQACVATGEPVPATIAEDFALRFLPEGTPEGDEIELSAEECDTMFFDGGAIDLGEAAAETLALALDPFPRAADADRILREAGVVQEDEVQPFSAFAALKDKLK
ncbi:YceD family protein [Sphingomonas sp. ac-8]|uniref:YceD family protein n=1 Tax=Sphingomonas sp. ac-8 TaxID=3242977 RepID=UPI003A811949